MFVLRGNRSRGGRSVSFREKIGVLGIHESMLPENSFPQICVVSINESVEISPNPQDYRRSADESNRVGVLIGNLRCFPSHSRISGAPYAAPGIDSGLETSERFNAFNESSILLSAPVLRISRPT